MSLLAFRDHAYADARVPLNGGKLVKSQIVMVTRESMFFILFFLQFWKCRKTHGTLSFKCSLPLPAIPMPSYASVAMGLMHFFA